MLCDLYIYCSEFSAPSGCLLWLSARFTSTERNAVHTKEAIMNLPLGDFFFWCSAFKLQSVLFMLMFKIAFWFSG